MIRLCVEHAPAYRMMSNVSCNYDRDPPRIEGREFPKGDGEVSRGPRSGGKAQIEDRDLYHSCHIGGPVEHALDDVVTGATVQPTLDHDGLLDLHVAVGRELRRIRQDCNCEVDRDERRPVEVHDVRQTVDVRGRSRTRPEGLNATG